MSLLDPGWTRGRRMVAAVVVSAVVAVAPATAAVADAQDTVVASDGTAVTVTAAAGVANRVTIDIDGPVLVVSESATSVIAAGACTQDGTGAARCPLEGVSEVRLSLGDLNDVVAKPRPLAPVVIYDGGDHNDTFVAAQVPDGADRYHGGAGTDIVSYGQRSTPVSADLAGDADDGAPGEGDAIATDVEALLGGTGDDVFTGGPGNDTLVGGQGDDVVSGGAGSDTLLDNLGDDVYDGGDGNDQIGSTVGADGADDIAGGPGVDIVSYGPRDANNAVTVTIDGIADDGLPGEGDNVRTDVENVAGSAGGDRLVGSAAANRLLGGAGDDRIDGGPGDDLEEGGPGNDTFDQGSAANGADVLLGGDGDDTADYSARTNAVTADADGVADDGEAGETDNVLTDIETIALPPVAPTECPGFEGDGRRHIIGTDGDDVLLGTAADDIICGLGGNDEIIASSVTFDPGSDVLLGGDGNDRLSAGPNADQLLGGDGDDALDGGAGADSLEGGAGADRLLGGPDLDVLIADAEPDGSDEFDGGSGIDRVSYARRISAVSVTAGFGFDDDGAPGEGDSVLASVEQVLGGAAGDTIESGLSPGDGGAGATLLGLGGNDRLIGGPANDVLSGGDGADVLVTALAFAGGDDGDDIFLGGAGVDAVSYENKAAGVTASLNGLADDGTTGAGEGDLISADVEQIFGTAAADRLTGSGGDDLLLGNGGDDLLVGLAGDDFALGADGNDTFDGGGSPDGADFFVGGAGTDTLTYARRTQTVEVDLTEVGGDGARGEDDSVLADVEVLLGGSSADFLTGASGPQLLAGGAGDDALVGEAGDDLLLGGDGDDRLIGEGGISHGEVASRDVFAGGNGHDAVSYSNAAEGVTVTIDDRAGDGIPGELDDVRTDVEEVHGSNHADTLVGSDAANTLVAGLGDDELRGRGGADDLRGGAGDDVFVMEAAPDGDDRVEGGNGVDLADYSARSADLNLALGAQTRVQESGDTDHLGPADDVEGIVGGDGHDLLQDFRDAAGVVAGARLFGGPGDDVISGPDVLTTADRLEGGPGDDRIRGLAGRDTIRGDSGADQLYGGLDSDADDIRGGTGPDQIFGDGGGDTLHGDEGDDRVIGGDGDDALFGDAGFDTVIGGDGFDRCDRGPDGGRLASCEAGP